MIRFQITSKACADFGIWEAASAEQALAALHRDAGYDVTVNADGEPIFASDDDARLCGWLDDWHVREIG